MGILALGLALLGLFQIIILVLIYKARDIFRTINNHWAIVPEVSKSTHRLNESVQNLNETKYREIYNLYQFISLKWLKNKYKF